MDGACRSSCSEEMVRYYEVVVCGVRGVRDARRRGEGKDVSWEGDGVVTDDGGVACERHGVGRGMAWSTIEASVKRRRDS